MKDLHPSKNQTVIHDVHIAELMENAVFGKSV